MKEKDTAITIALIFCFGVAIVGLFLGRDDQDDRFQQRSSTTPASYIIMVP